MPSTADRTSPTARATGLAGALAALALLAAPARAHDFWIEPSTYTPAPGAAVALRLRVGQHFLGDALPRDPELLRRFVAVSANGEAPVPGVAGTDPAGLLRPAPGPGAIVVGYESGPSVAELTPEKVEVYFAEEGLDRAAAARERAGETGGARDVFTRHVKTLLAVAGEAGAGFDRPLGLELELVPEADPYTMPGGGRLPVRLLRAREPVAGTRVSAIPRLHSRDVVTVRTGADGRATLPLGPGEWLLKAVTVERMPGNDDGDGDGVPRYRSRWASLTFAFPAASREAAP